MKNYYKVHSYGMRKIMADEIDSAVAELFNGATVFDLKSRDFSSKYLLPDFEVDKFKSVSSDYLSVSMKINLNGNVYLISYDHRKFNNWTVDQYFSDEFYYMVSDLAEYLCVDMAEIIDSVINELVSLTKDYLSNVYIREVRGMAIVK
jgi:hypothetical protein